MNFSRILSILSALSEGRPIHAFNNAAKGIQVDHASYLRTTNKESASKPDGDGRFDLDAIIAKKKKEWEAEQENGSSTAKGSKSKKSSDDKISLDDLAKFDPAWAAAQSGAETNPIAGDDTDKEILADGQPPKPPSGNRWRMPDDDNTGAGLQDTLKTVVHSEGQTQPPQDDDSSSAVNPGPDESDKEPSKKSTIMDSIQLLLDGIGIADPTPITDGINTAISLVRMKTDPDRKGEHAKNAMISAVSMVPYLGDTAKLAKTRRAGHTVERASDMARGGEGVSHTAQAAKAAKREEFRESAKAASEAVQRVIDARKEGSVAPPVIADNGRPYYQPAGPPITKDEASILDQREQQKGIEAHDKMIEKIADTAKNLAGLAGTAATAVVGVRTLNAGVLALNRELENVNGSIAATYAKADVADIRRDMDKSKALADPLEDLSTEQSELKDAMQELITPIQVIAIRFLTVLTMIANVVMKMAAVIQPLLDVLAWLSGFIPGLNGNANPTAPSRQFMADVADGKFDGRRPEFRGGRWRGQQIMNDQDHKDVFGP